MRTLVLRMSALLTLFALATASKLDAEPVKIRAGWVGAPASIIPFMFAKEGLSRHNGKSYLFEPVYFSGSPLEISAMASGELEVGTLGYSTFSIAVLNAGLRDFKIVADEIADGVEDYFSLNYAVRKDSPIQKVEDLGNKVVATNAIGAGAYIPLEVMLRKSGLFPNRDYRIVETNFANMKPMLLEFEGRFGHGDFAVRTRSRASGGDAGFVPCPRRNGGDCAFVLGNAGGFHSCKSQRGDRSPRGLRAGDAMVPRSHKPDRGNRHYRTLHQTAAGAYLGLRVYHQRLLSQPRCPA